MKNGNQPIHPQSENWQNDMEKHINTNNQSSAPSLQGIGLTKREYFAGLAMQGLLTRVSSRHGNELDLGILESKRIASESVYMADALLSELEAEQEVSND